MTRTLTLRLMFFALLCVAVWRTEGDATTAMSPGTALSRAAMQLKRSMPPAAPGKFPDEWIHGADCEGDPKIQVHAYNRDTWILRQSKCTTFEAPFMYLLFGDDVALLLDTGAAPSSPVADTVDRIIKNRLQGTGRETIPLIVAHTHSHFDHVASDSQFESVPYVQEIAPLGPQQAHAWWGFDNFPDDVSTIDLGNRVIDVLGSPGHQPASVTLYDRNTHLLLTGDIVYPGHLFIFSEAEWDDFRVSIQRLADWAATHPVQWVVGCHIETSNTPFAPYKYTTTVQPDEHPLEFQPSVLGKILDAGATITGPTECTIFDEFVIHFVYKCGIVWNG